MKIKTISDEMRVDANRRRARIHYHSDNSYWAGSEQMMIVFLTSELIKEHFDVTFSYRYSKEYISGMREWMAKAVGYSNGMGIMMARNYPLHNPLVSRLMKRRFLRAFQQLTFSDYKYKVREILEAIKPDIVHINNGGYPGAMGCNAAAIAAKEYGAKVIYMANGITPRGRARRWLEKGMDERVERSVDCFLAGSHYTMERLKADVFRTNYTRFEVIPNTLHQHPLIPKEEIRDRLNIPGTDIVVGSVGSFAERKGFGQLIEAFADVDWWEAGVRTCLLLVGSGPLEEKLLKQAAESKANVKFAIGREEEAYSYINAMDVYCQPSLEQEDLPNTIMMAMKLGKPIIATAVAGIPEMVTMHENGYLSKPGDIHGLGVNLSWMLKHLPMHWWVLMGEDSRRKHEARYSNEVVLNRYLELYNRLLERESTNEITFRRHL